MNDELGDRMKMLEGMESDRIFIPTLPVLARIDGKCFHNFTKEMVRPFDVRLSNLMIATTKYLVEETNAKCGYVQSDEISLIWYEPNYKSQIFFNGRIQKMCSVLAAMTSVYFNRKLYAYECDFDMSQADKLGRKMPIFDCRVWQVPSVTEATNCILWREQDATRNSIEMAVRYYYSHNELMNKDCSEKQELLHQKGINWNDYPNFFKRGSYIQKRNVLRKYTTTELEQLPKNHEARTDPNLEYIRSEIKILDLPPLGKIKNREDVLIFGADPLIT